MTEVETLKDNLKAICKEGETVKERYAKRMADNKTKFDAIFTKIWEIEPRGKESMNPFASSDEITIQAIKAARLSGDSTVIEAFKDHMKDYELFYNLDGQAMKLNMEIISIEIAQQKQQEQQVNGWKFKNLSIIAPQEIHQKVIEPMMQEDAKVGKGFFANVTQIPEELDLDEFLMIEPYDIKSSFFSYLDELKSFKVVGEDAFLCDEFTRVLFTLLRECALFIQNHTDQPSKTKNHISSIIKELDKLPIWGLFIQILLLQGLCRWLEDVDINEGEKGYKEAESMYKWLRDWLMKKEALFCYVNYGDEDKERLKPFCNYLYSTEIGRLVQAKLFSDDKGSKPHQKNNPPILGELTLPSELDTEQAKVLLQRAIQNNLCDNSHKWLKTKALLAYFADKASEYLKLGKGEYDGKIKTSWKPFETLFSISKLSGAKRDYQKTGTLPDGYKEVDKLFE